ncbi:conserved Plasmodium protein, unknown function [Plasmodium sp. gorilla clade G2]|uniref:conserved Plasmodium protein, unknown function n=1 Tax=Plasmodium sp. gorilla clade G2 TaxID=880535 RepID=UPI000D20435C|nr:conserved Plasmodium protein, unknown function [Plasmodium sp. gorilla clade G2]SOV13560.1 conserved Plasmodium protein, unknown function [Plasmodium sp. gorilla clade G2]
MIRKRLQSLKKDYLKCQYRNIISSSIKKKKYNYKEESLNLYVAFNYNINLCHERFEKNIYLYDVNSTVFKLSKYIHKFKKYIKNETKKKKEYEKNDKYNYKIEQLFMCYISLHNNINRDIFLRLTRDVLSFPSLKEKIINDKKYYEYLLYEIIKCGQENKVDKIHFYEYVIKIISSFLLNSTLFFNELFERNFFLEFLNLIKKEDINNYINNFTYLLSCISLYKRALKQNITFHNNKDLLLSSKFLSENNTNILIEKKKNEILLDSLNIILQIFDKIQNYHYFKQIDICNIFDFLNEFKTFHKIKICILINIHKYLIPSSDMKHLCLLIYLITSNNNSRNIYKECIQQDAYKYIYNIIFLRRNELYDIKNWNLFLLSLIKYKKNEYTNNIMRKRKIKNIKMIKSNGNINEDINENVNGHNNKISGVPTNRQINKSTNMSLRSSKKRNSIKYNKKFELCLNVKNRYMNKKKKYKERILYFSIKNYFMQLIEQEKKKKLNPKYIKTFYEYFSFYHIKKNCIRKKNYISPLVLIQNYESEKETHKKK